MNNAIPTLPELTLTGPTTTEMAIGTHGDYVVLSFPTPTQNFVVHHKDAWQLAEIISRNALASELREDVEGRCSALVQKKRQDLTVKVVHVLKSAVLNKELGKPSEIEIVADRIVNHAQDEFIGTFERHLVQ